MLGFYISRFFNQTNNENDAWYPTDYNPEITVQQWVELLQNKDIFTSESLQIMKRMKDYGGSATCKQLAVKYGETYNFYNSGSSYLGKRIAQHTCYPVMTDNNENSRWWPILYLGRNPT